MRFVIHTSCDHEFGLPENWPQTPEELERMGATFDCPDCGSIQIMKELVVVIWTPNFHEYLHAKGEDPVTGFRWPVDGKGTGFIEVSTPGEVHTQRVTSYPGTPCMNPECPKLGSCGGECARNF